MQLVCDSLCLWGKAQITGGYSSSGFGAGNENSVGMSRRAAERAGRRASRLAKRTLAASVIAAAVAVMVAAAITATAAVAEAVVPAAATDQDDEKDDPQAGTIVVSVVKPHLCHLTLRL